jgi:hypothetical protein
MKIFVLKSEDDDAESGSAYRVFRTLKAAQAAEAQLAQDTQPRVLASVTLDKALQAILPGTMLYIFESEVDSEMVFLCAATRAAAEAGLNLYCGHKGGAENYDLDHPITATVE